jgi:hypothetical protein
MFTLRAVYHREDPTGVAHLVAYGENVLEWVQWKIELGMVRLSLGVSAEEAYADLIVDNLTTPLDPGEADRLERLYGLRSGLWCWVTFTATPDGTGSHTLFISDARPEEAKPVDADDCAAAE